ncbi:hypothetical protein TRFO_22929 [Tritrichomonas foetus]|uniref:Uncharacterized protein n=1 Tax=Tritrichomonas foetus TaxID=1144522 RepID=A0A1J4KAQ6_9EUKA|nr:hypothetical protein TRFO_22929 [Tritrichomonas foetus]|eukprot:OHT08511.1 hypothetical protein TRFO_22929 [Tritrichomonas foetus]
MNDSIFADALNIPGLELLDFDEQLRLFLALESPRQIYEIGRKIFIGENKTEIDSEICFKLMLAASENKICESDYFLGKYYLEGIYPVIQNLDKAFYYFTRITKSFHFDSDISSETLLQSRIDRKLKNFHFKTISGKMTQLEQEIENGYYKEIKGDKTSNDSQNNEKKYHRKERKEIDEIISYSFLYLGFIYENLLDFKNAYQMFIRSANMHNYDALTAVSIYRITGRGGAYRNKNEGMKLLTLCSEKCSSYAYFNLSEAYNGGTYFLKNEYKSFNYFCKAILSHNLIAVAALAVCLYFGRGIEPNEELGKDIYYIAYYLSKSGLFKSSKLYKKLFLLLQPYIGKYQNSPKYAYLTDHVHNTLFNSFCCQPYYQVTILSYMSLFFNGYQLSINEDRGFNAYVKGFLLKGSHPARNLGVSYSFPNSSCSQDEDQSFHLFKLANKYKINGLSVSCEYLLGNYYFQKDFPKYNPSKGTNYYMKAIENGHNETISTLYSLFLKNKIPLFSEEMKLMSNSTDSLNKLYFTQQQRKNMPKSKLLDICSTLKYIYKKQKNKLAMYPYGRELLFSGEQILMKKGQKIIEKALMDGAVCTNLSDICYEVAELMDLAQYKTDKNIRTNLLFLLNIGCLHGFSSCHDMLAMFMKEYKYPEERIHKHFRIAGLLEDGFTRQDYAEHLVLHHNHEFDQMEIASEMFLRNNDNEKYQELISYLKSKIN